MGTLDSVGAIGGESSITVGSDGLGLISYFDASDPVNPILKVAHCSDRLCSDATVSTITRLVGKRFDNPMASSVAVGSDGLGLISFLDGAGLRVAHCDDIKCSSATTTTLDGWSGFRRGSDTSIMIGADGLGLVTYHYRRLGTADAMPLGNLRVAHCSDIRCGSGTITTLDSGGGDVGLYNSVALGPDGFAMISYSGEAGLKLASCLSESCTTSKTVVVDSWTGFPKGGDTSLAIRADGLVLIIYRQPGDGTLRMAHCQTLEGELKRTLVEVCGDISP